jgi:hypothetical protein
VILVVGELFRDGGIAIFAYLLVKLFGNMYANYARSQSSASAAEFADYREKLTENGETESYTRVPEFGVYLIQRVGSLQVVAVVIYRQSTQSQPISALVGHVFLVSITENLWQTGLSGSIADLILVFPPSSIPK